MKDWESSKVLIEEAIAELNDHVKRAVWFEISDDSAADLSAAFTLMLERLDKCETAFKRQGELLAKKVKQVERLEGLILRWDGLVGSWMSDLQAEARRIREGE